MRRGPTSAALIPSFKTVSTSSARDCTTSSDEQHTEDWLSRTARYLTACESFVSRAMIESVTFAAVPERPPLPRPQWFLAVFVVRDVMCRLDDVKAKITSTHGAILKMDSTKKVLEHSHLIIYLVGLKPSLVLLCTFYDVQ